MSTQVTFNVPELGDVIGTLRTVTGHQGAAVALIKATFPDGRPLTADELAVARQYAPQRI